MGVVYSMTPVEDLYEIHDQVLGQGAYGEVRVASMKAFPDKKFAIKII